MTDATAKRREERIKLFASALSNVGVATVIAGYISPLLGSRFHLAAAAGALPLGMGLHFVAQTLLHYVVVDELTPGSSSEAEPEA